MIIGATFFIGSLLRWGFQLMEKILKPEEDVELIKEVDKEVEAKERALLVWDSHMKALIDSDLQKRLPYEVLHGAGPAPSYSTQAGHPLRCYSSSANWSNSRYCLGAQEVRIPVLVEQTKCQLLVISECTSDLTNIKTHPWHLQKFLAEISASNTLRTAEDAIKGFSFLQEVLIVSCPPRCNSRALEELNLHRSQILAKKVRESTMCERIKYRRLDLEEDKEILLRQSEDGIHFAHCKSARKIYTIAVIDAILDA